MKNTLTFAETTPAKQKENLTFPCLRKFQATGKYSNVNGLIVQFITRNIGIVIKSPDANICDLSHKVGSLSTCWVDADHSDWIPVTGTLTFE